MSEETYTLDEARAELARRECADHGHSWDIISTFDGVPRKLVCSTCGQSHNVEMPKP